MSRLLQCLLALVVALTPALRTFCDASCARAMHAATTAPEPRCHEQPSPTAALAAVHVCGHDTDDRNRPSAAPAAPDSPGVIAATYSNAAVADRPGVASTSTASRPIPPDSGGVIPLRL